MTIKVPLMTRVAAHVRQLARAKARMQNRTLNNYIETLILKDNGLAVDEGLPADEIDIGFEEATHAH
jgi:hypothetical protein